MRLAHPAERLFAEVAAPVAATACMAVAHTLGLAVLEAEAGIVVAEIGAAAAEAADPEPVGWDRTASLAVVAAAKRSAVAAVGQIEMAAAVKAALEVH